jgi:putative tryptophan/tyrosine transport system substrate-binding protein
VSIFRSLRHLILGFLLIAAAAAILLISDWSQRRTVGPLKRVALLQQASQSSLDEGVQGYLDALADRGFVNGKTISLQRFNAENDIATGNAIAKQIVDGGYDLILTASTPSLQTVANANRAGKRIHVFGIVTDPFTSGVGLDQAHPLDHPKYMTGIGSLVSVEAAFKLAKTLYPHLRSVGLVWNVAESNSQTYTKLARAAAAKLGIELLEANAENSSNVGEAANSLVSRGAEALWISGDVTVLVAADSVVAAARKGSIPAFSIIPPTVTKGTLFDLGADFYGVGRLVGDLAAKILSGTDPATVPVLNVVPSKLAVNKTALTRLRDPWRIPQDVLDRAQLVIDQTGMHKQTRLKQATLHEEDLLQHAGTAVKE